MQHPQTRGGSWGSRACRGPVLNNRSGEASFLDPFVPLAPAAPRRPMTPNGRSRKFMVPESRHANRKAAPESTPGKRATFTMPDFILDTQNWFNHFDRRGYGMTNQELIAALAQTYRDTATRAMLEDIVCGIWSNKSRLIIFDDFNERGGIRDSLLACLGEPPVATSASTSDKHKFSVLSMLQQPTPSETLQPVLRKRPVSASQRTRSFTPTENSASTMATEHRSSVMMPASLQGLSAMSSKLQRASSAFQGRRQPPPWQSWQSFTDPGSGYDGFVGGSREPGGQPLLSQGQLCRALLIGINYFGSPAALQGCINDVNNMYKLLTETYGWSPAQIRVLTDDNGLAMPTHRNIINALHWLREGVRPGDVLFFHFSGHGAQKKDPNGYEEDGMNETILPADFAKEGMISDDLIGEILVRCLPENSRLIAVMDCCHSGTGLDLPFKWNGRFWLEETNPYHVAADVQLFSGCEDSQTSAEVAPRYDRASGAMTTAFCELLRIDPCPSYPDLMARLTDLLHRRGFSQKAQLTSSQRFDFNRLFIPTDIVPNSNPTLGRTFRRKFAPRPRRIIGPLKDILLTGAAVWGGLVLLDTLTWLGASAVHAAIGG